MLLNLISTALGLLTVLTYVVLCAHLDGRRSACEEDQIGARDACTPSTPDGPSSTSRTLQYDRS